MIGNVVAAAIGRIGARARFSDRSGVNVQSQTFPESAAHDDDDDLGLVHSCC